MRLFLLLVLLVLAVLQGDHRSTPRAEHGDVRSASPAAESRPGRHAIPAVMAAVTLDLADAAAPAFPE